MNKKLIKEEILNHFELAHREFDIKEFASQLNSIESEIYHKITFEVKLSWDYGSECIETVWYGYRYETDKELETRKRKSIAAKVSAKKRKATIKFKKEKEFRDLIKKDPELVKKILEE